VLSRHQNVGQNRDIKIAKRSFENVSRFKYLGTTVTNQNLFQEEIGGDLILVMLATFRSRTFCLLVCCQKTLKMRIHNTIILPVVMYGCKAWPLTLREKLILRCLRTRLRRLFGP
jgi:hypothetical protein